MLAIGLLAPACKSGQYVASIERTFCFGPCPVYKVTVFAAGRVTYDGEEWVKIKGHREGRLSAGQMRELDAVFEKFGYHGLRNSYERWDWTDMQTVNTSDGSNTIIHNHGDKSAPASLSELEDEIDRIINVEQGIGTEAERDRLWRRDFE
jgi:hypothetical protein